jgi:hypothetical protein
MFTAAENDPRSHLRSLLWSSTQAKPEEATVTVALRGAWSETLFFPADAVSAEKMAAAIREKGLRDCPQQVSEVTIRMPSGMTHIFNDQRTRTIYR